VGKRTGKAGKRKAHFLFKKAIARAAAKTGNRGQPVTGFKLQVPGYESCEKNTVEYSKMQCFTRPDVGI
jgi:hypothetical protein